MKNPASCAGFFFLPPFLLEWLKTATNGQSRPSAIDSELKVRPRKKSDPQRKRGPKKGTDLSPTNNSAPFSLGGEFLSCSKTFLHSLGQKQSLINNRFRPKSASHVSYKTRGNSLRLVLLSAFRQPKLIILYASQNGADSIRRRVTRSSSWRQHCSFHNVSSTQSSTARLQ